MFRVSVCGAHTKISQFSDVNVGCDSVQYAHRAQMSASGVLPQVQHTLVWGWDLFIGLQLRNQTRLASQ